MTDRGRAWVRAEWGPMGLCDDMHTWLRQLDQYDDPVLIVRSWPFRAHTGTWRRIDVAVAREEYL